MCSTTTCPPHGAAHQKMPTHKPHTKNKMQMQQKLAPKLLKMDFINGLRQQFIVHYYYYYCADMAAESAQMH